jgi:hypothetical protein
MTYQEYKIDAAMEMVRNAIVHFRACAARDKSAAEDTSDRFYAGLACAEEIAAERLDSILKMATGEMYHGQTFDAGGE